MPKLSEYVRMAADEYVREHGNMEPSARWLADFFHECGVQDEYPRQDLVAFAAMVPGVSFSACPITWRRRRCC